MESLWLAAGTALWLGVLTSISPCPLATNIVAVSFLSRQINHPWRVLLAGALYTAGRMLTYVVVSAIVVWSLLSASQLSYALQHWLNLVLGPLLIVVGLVMLGWIPLPLASSSRQSSWSQRAESFGLWGAALLGMIFALTFCPVSAALFFGSLIPIGVQAHSTFVIPTVYAIGTALPVLLFAILLALGVRSLSGVFNWLTGVERWARSGTAVIFVLIGLHLSLVHLVGVDLTEPLWKT